MSKLHNLELQQLMAWAVAQSNDDEVEIVELSENSHPWFTAVLFGNDGYQITGATVIIDSKTVITLNLNLSSAMRIREGGVVSFYLSEHEVCDALFQFFHKGHTYVFVRTYPHSVKKFYE